MQQTNMRLNRRGFLKGLGITAGSLMVPTILTKSAFAQQVTEVSLYARLAGTGRPPITLTSFDPHAWICLGDEIELFWVTTPDVKQVDLGSELGIFSADQGGNENGLNWGSTTVAPSSHTSFQIFAIDGNFEAGNAAHVRVFGQPKGAGPFSPIDEESFEATLVSATSVRTRERDTWQAVLPSTRFSKGLHVSDIKASGASLQSPAYPWRIVKFDEDGFQRNFAISPINNYQRPFTPPDANLTIPLAGTWDFSSRSPDISSRRLPFTVKLVCV